MVYFISANRNSLLEHGQNGGDFSSTPFWKGGCTHDYGTACKCNGGYGNYVEILHDNGMITLYAHLAERKVSVGQKVALGDTIGLIGATGNVVSSGGGGYHLHFGVIKDGAFVNPRLYLP